MTKKKKNGSSPPKNAGSGSRTDHSGQELIVITRSDAGLRATSDGVASVAGANVRKLNDLLISEGVTIKPLFGASEDRIRAEVASVAAESGHDVPDLSVYYRVDAPENQLEDLAERFLEMDEVEGAYVKPPTEPASVTTVSRSPLTLNQMASMTDEPPSTTPNYVPRQAYLNAAPVGIEAQYAWTVPGGRGAGVRIIDIEWGWRFTHEDLHQNMGGVLSGVNSSALGKENHGTAVIGVMGGDQNTFGITGICPHAHISAVSLETHSTEQAIRIAADQLNAGDIILLEVHRSGPRSNQGSGQFGYIAIEWWPGDLAAIRYAVAKGIIVVEAAGNGGQNLDDAVYNTRPAGFPASWKNPFNPANPSSGAVLVGAGNPPAGIHGRNAQENTGEPYADRARCYFSNFGARVDAQGWGWEVTATGYGDLQGGSDRNKWYTDRFSGTSSASPIVVGALACLQGVLRTHGRPLLTPAKAIQVLRASGSAQQNGPGFTFPGNMAGSGYPQNHPARSASQRIGNRPNLRQLIQQQLNQKSLRLIDLEITRVGTQDRFSGVFVEGTGSYGLWANATWQSFLQKWQQWSSQGMRLIDFEINQIGLLTRYSGVFRRGSGSHGLWVNATWPSFLQKWQQWSNQGMRLIDIDVTNVMGQLRYSGVFRHGAGSHGLWVNATWPSFQQKWQQWSSQGMRLVDLEVHQVGTQLRYSGVFRQGAGGHALWANASWQSFRQKWQQWSQRGLRLVSFSRTRIGTVDRYSGVFRQGTGAYGLWVNASWSSFLQKWQEWNTHGIGAPDVAAPGFAGPIPAGAMTEFSPTAAAHDHGNGDGGVSFDDGVHADAPMADGDGFGEVSFESSTAAHLELKTH